MFSRYTQLEIAHITPFLFGPVRGFIGFRDAVNITGNTRLALRSYEFSTRRQFQVPEIPRCITRRSYSHMARDGAKRTMETETIFIPASYTLFLLYHSSWVYLFITYLYYINSSELVTMSLLQRTLYEGELIIIGNKTISFSWDYITSCAGITRCHWLSLFIIPSVNLIARSCNSFWGH